MDDIFRKTLINCYTYLLENIQYDNLSDYLLQYGVIPNATIENINSLTDRRQKLRKLLDVLPRRGNAAFEEFLRCLQDSSQSHIAETLRCKLQEICSQNQSSLNENGFLPSPPTQELQHLSFPQGNFLQNQLSQPNSSSAECGIIESNNETEIPTSIMCTEQVGTQVPEPEPLQTMEMEVERGCYEMNSDPRGYMLIINNEKFTAPLLDRSGSMKDASDLMQLFWNLGFYCDIKHNLEVEEIKKHLLDFSQMDEHKNLSCCGVVLMSHGVEDPEEHIYGTKGKKVSVNDLLINFNDQNCPNLKNKPKLFIVQACRNTNNDSATTKTAAAKDPDIGNDFSRKPALLKLVSIDLSQDAEKPGESRRSCVNSRADMLIAYSTAHGNSSFRHKKTGSIFIQIIIEVFNKMAHNTSVTDMLIEVNGKLRQRYFHQEQIAVPEVALTKKWYLKPK